MTTPRRDDKELFERLYDAHAAELMRFCLRRTGDPASAEDFVAIIFLEAWRKRDVLVPETVRAWLYGIALNVMRNHRRSAMRHRRALSELAALRPPHDSRDPSKRTVHGLLDDLAKLPRDEVDVVTLCLWSGLSQQEAAVALGVPTGTVKSRLSRARKHLAELRRSSNTGTHPSSLPSPRTNGVAP